MNRKALLVGLFAIVLFAGRTICAADDPSADGGMKFDSRIDTWMEGTVASVNIDDKKFTVKGAKMPYATTFAQMLKEINKIDPNLSLAERTKREQDIREKWAEKLIKTRSEKPGASVEFTFALPSKNVMPIFDIGAVKDVIYLQPPGAIVGGPRPADEKPAEEGVKSALHEMTLRDLRVGESVMVGYDAGVITNDAYVTVKQEAAQQLSERPR